jgi:hypothetical protein
LQQQPVPAQRLLKAARSVARLLAWTLLVAVAVATLAPIGLRPSSGLPPQAERFAAFLLVGAAFVVAYRSSLAWIVALVLGSAVALELLQLAAPGRHGMIADAGAKLAGAACGLLIGWAVVVALTRFDGRLEPRG